MVMHALQSCVASWCRGAWGSQRWTCRLATTLTTLVIIPCHSRARRKSGQDHRVESVERISPNVWRERLP